MAMRKATMTIVVQPNPSTPQPEALADYLTDKALVTARLANEPNLNYAFNDGLKKITIIYQDTEFIPYDNN